MKMPTRCGSPSGNQEVPENNRVVMPEVVHGEADPEDNARVQDEPAFPGHSPIGHTRGDGDLVGVAHGRHKPLCNTH